MIVRVSSAAFGPSQAGRDANIFVSICAQAILAGASVLDMRAVSYLTVLMRGNVGATMTAASLCPCCASPGLIRATPPPGQRLYASTPD